MAYNRDRQAQNDAPEFIEKVVYLNRVSKTVKGGRVMKFSALTVRVLSAMAWARLPKFPKLS